MLGFELCTEYQASTIQHSSTPANTYPVGDIEITDEQTLSFRQRGDWRLNMRVDATILTSFKPPPHPSLQLRYALLATKTRRALDALQQDEDKRPTGWATACEETSGPPTWSALQSSKA